MNINKKRNFAVFITLLTISAIIHFYRFSQMAAFDADQDFYALEYLKIFKEGKLTLLGIEASVGGLFVGPLYTYFSSFIYLFSAGNPIGIFTATIIIASLQGSLTYLLFSRLKDQKTGVIAGIVVIFSHALWQKAFAPSVIGLLYIFGLLFFYFLSTISNKPKNLILLALICGISISIHISLFVFIPFTAIYLLIKRPKNVKLRHVILSGLFLLAFASPLIIFDLRHNYYLWKNLLDFLSNGSNSVKTTSYFQNFLNVTKSTFNMFATFLFPPQIIGKLAVIMTIPYLLLKLKKDNSIQQAIFIIILSLIILSFYFGSFSDYYLYFLLAPLLFIFSSFLAALFSYKISKLITVVLVALLIVSNLKEIQKSKNPYNYFIKSRAVSYIKSQAQDKKIKIYFDTEPGLGFGFQYLFKYHNLNVSEENYEEIYQIVVKGKELSPGVAFQQKGVENTIRVVKLKMP